MKKNVITTMKKMVEIIKESSGRYEYFRGQKGAYAKCAARRNLAKLVTAREALTLLGARATYKIH